MSEKDLPIFRKDRMSTGVKALDIMLEGGYKFPGIALLMAPTGSEKQCFAAHFVKAGLLRCRRKFPRSCGSVLSSSSCWSLIPSPSLSIVTVDERR